MKISTGTSQCTPNAASENQHCMTEINRTNVDRARAELMAEIAEHLDDVPRNFTKTPGGPKSQQVMEKYGNRPDRLDPEEWGTLTFNPTDDEQSRRVWSLTDAVRSRGYSFDTGGAMGIIDWELDWSFHFEKP